MPLKVRPADHPLIVHIASMDGIGYWADEISEYAIAFSPQISGPVP